jgi:hypothetical protein
MLQQQGTVQEFYANTARMQGAITNQNGSVSNNRMEPPNRCTTMKVNGAKPRMLMEGIFRRRYAGYGHIIGKEEWRLCGRNAECR